MVMQQKVNKPVPGVKFKNNLDKLVKLFFKPRAFFKGVANEQNYFPILLYFVVVLAIVQLINWILSIPGWLQQPYGAFSVIGGFFGVIIGIGLAFGLPFVYAGIYHLGVLMFGGRKGYFNTFKPMTYAGVVGAIYALILYIVVFVLSLVNPMSEPTPGMSLSFMNLLRSIPIIYIITYVLIGVVSFIHTYYIEVIGIAKFHEISKLRAFLAVLVMMIIMTLLIAIPLILLFQFIASLPPAVTA